MLSHRRVHHHVVFLLSACIFLLFIHLCFLQSGRAEETTSKPSKPANTDNNETTPPPTLWSFAWVSDMHMNPKNREFLAGAMHYIDTVLKPNFVLITGDNNYIAAPLADPAKLESKELCRQRFCKEFLQKNLKTPYVIIPGDNWPQEFDKVFGSKQFSFDFGGIHFLFLAPDRAFSAPKVEGLSVFDKSTLDWMQRDLKRNTRLPTLVVIHEPIYPPTFLDAPLLRELLNGYSNVFAVLQGHLHRDLEYRVDGRTYLVAPSLGVRPNLGMKLVSVTPTNLIVRSIRYDIPNRRFETQKQCQTIDIPALLRSRLATPKDSQFVKANYDALPARPLIRDPSLEKRKNELLSLMITYLLGKE